ncbi:MAG: hypothetical protein Q4E54_07290 [Lachnospiraceae bacterium]|nr:hypothetical protein [Lachnospiraceae bacterium]
MINKLLELKILPNRKFTPALTSAAACCLSVVSEDEKFIASVTEALSLAVDNVILHGSSSRDYDISLDIYADDNTLYVELKDTGIPYEFSGTAETQKIMETVNDFKLSYGREFGRSQLMTFAFNEALPPFEAENHDNETAVTDVQIRLRDTVPSDFTGVSRSFYRELGFTYFNNAIYNPDDFKKYISREDYHSLTAETEDGMFAGLHMLKSWDNIPDVYEGGTAITSPLVRKCGAFSRLMDANNDYFEHVVAKGVQISEAVTAHDITQKTRLKYGYTPCGFAFNQHSADEYKNSFQTYDGRATTALSCHVIDHSPKEIFVPAEVTHVLDVIYEGENLPRTYHTDAAAITLEKTVVEASISKDIYCPVIIIRSVGNDYEDVISDIIYRLKKCERDMAYVYLCVEHPGVIEFYETLKKTGFRFCGLVPNTGYGDLMLIENPITSLINYDSIVTTGSFTDMLNMIREFDPDYRK